MTDENKYQQDKQEFEAKLVKHFNTIMLDPSLRAGMVHQLAELVGQLIMIPTPMLDQFITAIDRDAEEIKKNQATTKSPILEALLGMTTEMLGQELITIKAFRDVRASLLEKMKERGAERMELIPE